MPECMSECMSQCTACMHSMLMSFVDYSIQVALLSASSSVRELDNVNVSLSFSLSTGVPRGICYTVTTPAAVMQEGLSMLRRSSVQELSRILSSLTDARNKHSGSLHTSCMTEANSSWRDPHLQALGKECPRSSTPLEMACQTSQFLSPLCHLHVWSALCCILLGHGFLQCLMITGRLVHNLRWLLLLRLSGII